MAEPAPADVAGVAELDAGHVADVADVSEPDVADVPEPDVADVSAPEVAAVADVADVAEPEPDVAEPQTDAEPELTVLAEPEIEPEPDPVVEPEPQPEPAAAAPAASAEPAAAAPGSAAEPEPAAPERRPSVDALWAPVRFQEGAVAALRGAERAPTHAYLLLGPAGAGPRAAARAFATALLCPSGGCGVCATCVRTMAEQHPDLVVVEREGPSISVDQAREIIRLALRSPVEGARKVLVLVDFHLVQQAGPTLLKIIEEPPASTVFVVLAEHLPPELVTIASRCVRVDFRGLRPEEIITVLVDEGATPERAAKAAASSAGNLDRARLLVTDDRLAQRVEFWQSVPRRLDGTGAAASSLAAEAVALLDAAAVGPLEARHQAELAAFEARLEATGQQRGSAGQRKELQDRHRRELKRLRDDELRLGLSILQREQLARMAGDDAVMARRAGQGLDAVTAATQHLERNPSVPLLLQALFLKLHPPR